MTKKARTRLRLNVEKSIEMLLEATELRPLDKMVASNVDGVTAREVKLTYALMHLDEHDSRSAIQCVDDPCRRRGLAEALSELVDGRDSPVKVAVRQFADAVFDEVARLNGVAEGLAKARSTFKLEQRAQRERRREAKRQASEQLREQDIELPQLDRFRDPMDPPLRASKKIVDDLMRLATVLRDFDTSLRDMLTDPHDRRARGENQDVLIMAVTQCLGFDGFSVAEIAHLIDDGGGGALEARRRRVRDRLPPRVKDVRTRRAYSNVGGKRG